MLARVCGIFHMTCLYTILLIFLSILYLSIIISYKQKKIIMFHISSHLGVNSKFSVHLCVRGGEWEGVVYIPTC